VLDFIKIIKEPQNHAVFNNHNSQRKLVKIIQNLKHKQNKQKTIMQYADSMKLYVKHLMIVLNSVVSRKRKKRFV